MNLKNIGSYRMFCVIIRGPSASGKSTITRSLVKIFTSEKFVPGKKICMIHGDYLSNAIVGFSGKKWEIKLKYELFMSFLEKLLNGNTIIFINDVLSHDEYLRSIKERIANNNHKLIDIYLTAPLEILKSRNKAREPGDFVSNKRMNRYFHESTKTMDESHIQIDTSINTKQQTLKLILEYLINNDYILKNQKKIALNLY